MLRFASGGEKAWYSPATKLRREAQYPSCAGIIIPHTGVWGNVSIFIRLGEHLHGIRLCRTTADDLSESIVNIDVC